MPAILGKKGYSPLMVFRLSLIISDRANCGLVVLRPTSRRRRYACGMSHSNGSLAWTWCELPPFLLQLQLAGRQTRKFGSMPNTHNGPRRRLLTHRLCFCIILITLTSTWESVDARRMSYLRLGIGRCPRQSKVELSATL